MTERDIIANTTIPAQRLKSIEEFSTQPVNPFVADFARLLADRLKTYPEIVPMGFMMAATILIYDLGKGVNGFTNEPINSSLVKRSPEIYGILDQSIPYLAKIAFEDSPEFANAVANEWMRVMAEFSAAQKLKQPKLPEKPADPDIIRTDIETIDQAKTLILGDAKSRILALGWEKFGIRDLDEIGKILEPTLRIILRNAEMGFQLNILNDTTPAERALLKQIPPERKINETGEYWLALLSGKISAEEATFIRDWLWIKGPEAIAAVKELPIKRVLIDFGQSNPSFEKAAFRVRDYMFRRRI